MIRSAIGKDATAIFNGGVYNHSNAAHNLLSNFRVAVVRGGCEVEVWKQQQQNTVFDSNGKRIVRAEGQATRIRELAGAAAAS